MAIKEKHFYICDREFAIASGHCNGFGCVDKDISDETFCRHTSDSAFALYDLKNNTNEWEKVVLNDNKTGKPIVTWWEIDPRDEKENMS